MPLSYSQRSLVLLLFLGLLSAIMSVLSVVLLFQLRSQASGSEAPPQPVAAAAALLPAPVWAVLRPVCTVLSALSLTVHLSSVTVCLLHGYFSTELSRGDSDRADWFLLDSRAVRHVAVGLFCLGVSVYLAAMSIFMLLIFEVETGIASVCVLSSGILVLLVIVIHSLVKASRNSKRYRDNHLDTLFQNEHGGGGGVSVPAPRPCELKIGADKPRMPRTHSHLQHPFSYPHNALQQEHYLQQQQQQQQQQYSPTRGSQGHASDKDGYSSGGSGPRMHRTLSTESGLLPTQAKPWKGVNNEMRSVLARKSGITAKDSTLV